MFSGTSREIFSVTAENNDTQLGTLSSSWPGPMAPHPPPSCSDSPVASRLAWSISANSVYGPWSLAPWSGGPSYQCPHSSAGHPWLVLPSWQSRELCAFSTRIPPGCGEAATGSVRRRDQPCPHVPQGHPCSPGLGLGAVPLPVLPLQPKGFSDPIPNPSHLSITSDLHQQGLYHGVHAPLGWHHRHLIAAELLRAEGLGTDGDVHLPCRRKGSTQSPQSPHCGPMGLHQPWGFVWG